MSRVVDMGNPDRRRLIAFGLIAVALLLALGCTRVDEVTPPPIATPTITPTPTPIPIDYDCVVGLRLEQGEACAYRDGEESDFVLAVREDGSTYLDGSLGPLMLSERITEPDAKVCACGLETEWDGTARTVTALPQPFLEVERPRYVEPPPIPFLGECVMGMEVEAGEFCVYPGSLCAFEVSEGGLGHFLTFSHSESIEANGVTNGELIYDFQAEGSGEVWTIRDVPPPMGEDFIFSDRVNCPPDQQVARLSDAIWRHDIDQVQRLIDDGVNPDGLNQYGWRLLEFAIIYSGDYESSEIVRRFVDAGADVNAFNVHGYPILEAATQDETIEVLRLMLDGGAEPNLRSYDGHTVLQRAARSGNKGAIRLLVEAGADVNALDHDGDSILQHALELSEVETVETLLDVGVSVHGTDRTGFPWLYTASLGGPEKVQLMLNAGADVNARSSFGQPVLSILAERASPEIVKMLLDAGANPDVCDASGRVPLFYAIQSGQVENVQALVESGANVNVFDREGDPLLVRALRRGIDSIVRIFVNAGADVNAIDSDGKTMLELARQIGSQPAVQYLIDAGAE